MQCRENAGRRTQGERRVWQRREHLECRPRRRVQRAQAGTAGRAGGGAQMEHLGR